MTALRWLGFGDLDAGIWGVGWAPGGSGEGQAALGAGDDTGVLRFELDDSEEAWRLQADGLALTIERTEPGALARATGSFTLDGTERAVDAPAWHETLPDPGQLGSLRLLTAFYDGDEALALAALRAPHARGQEDDQMVAALIESGLRQEVTDARLSTTYGGDGLPARAGIELWISEPAQEPGTFSERPHRLAGEASGNGLKWSDSGVELTAQPFRWHSHGRDGLGAYVLGRSG